MIADTEGCFVDVGYCDFKFFILLLTSSDECLFSEVLGYADSFCLISAKEIGDGYFAITISLHHVFVCVIYQDNWERRPFCGFLRALKQIEQMEVVFLGCYDHLFLNEHFGVAFDVNVRRTAVVRQRFFSLRSFYMKHEILARLFTHEAKKTFVGKRMERGLEVSLYELLAISFESLFAYLIEEKCIGFEDDVAFLESLKTVLPEEERVIVKGTQGENLFELANAFREEDFTDIGCLGVGGQGTVLLGFHQKLYHLFALKMYHRLEFSDRVIHEYDCLCCLRHPCVVHAYGYLSKVSIPYAIVLEFCVHGSVPYDLTTLSYEEAHKFVEPAMGDIAFAVDYVNFHGYVHGDVKEGNVLVSYGYYGRLSDFGSCIRLRSADMLEHMAVFERKTTTKFWNEGKILDNGYLVDVCMLWAMYQRMYPHVIRPEMTNTLPIPDITLAKFLPWAQFDPERSCIKVFLALMDIFYTSASFDRIKHLLLIQNEYMKKTKTAGVLQLVTCLWLKSEIVNISKSVSQEYGKNEPPCKVSDALAMMVSEAMLSDCITINPERFREPTWSQELEEGVLSPIVRSKLYQKGKYLPKDMGRAIEVLLESGNTRSLVKLYTKMGQYKAAWHILYQEQCMDVDDLLMLIKLHKHRSSGAQAAEMARNFSQSPRVKCYYTLLWLKELRDRCRSIGRPCNLSESLYEMMPRHWQFAIGPRNLKKVWKVIEIAEELGMRTNKSAWLQLIRKYVDFGNFLDNLDMSVECRNVPGLKGLRKWAIAKGFCKEPDRHMYVL